MPTALELTRFGMKGKRLGDVHDIITFWKRKGGLIDAVLTGEGFLISGGEGFTLDTLISLFRSRAKFHGLIQSVKGVGCE